VTTSSTARARVCCKTAEARTQLNKGGEEKREEDGTARRRVRSDSCAMKGEMK
jgi:hypothetical protein